MRFLTLWVGVACLFLCLLIMSCSFKGTAESHGGGSDDDDDPLCVDIVANSTGTCFDDLTAASLCSLDDAQCWVDCFQAADTCTEWITCVEADCPSAAIDDEDSAPTCEESLDGEVEECFSGLTTDDICSTDDAQCWVDCFGSSEDCGEWVDCVESTCIES